MTLAVYYPFSQTDWYRACVAYLDLQHQGLVVLMLLLAVADGEQREVPQVPADRAPERQGTLRARASTSRILLGALLAPEYFLFPLGLVLRGVRDRARHRAGPDGAPGAGRRSLDDQLAEATEPTERRPRRPHPSNGAPAGPTGASSQRTDELSRARSGDAEGRPARSAGAGRRACARRPGLRARPAGSASAAPSSSRSPRRPAPRPRRGCARCATSCCANPVTEDYLLQVEEA